MQCVHLERNCFLKSPHGQDGKPEKEANNQIENNHDRGHFFFTNYKFLPEQINCVVFASCDQHVLPVQGGRLRQGTFWWQCGLEKIN